MLQLAADENFDNRIVAGLSRRNPDLNIIRIQDTDLLSAADPTMLGWVATQQRILLTHDIRTLPDFAYERIRAGLAMTGVIVVQRSCPIGQAIDEILLLLAATTDDEWQGRVRFVPL
ncbi:MAG: DUF5615 family PIN-like protein [Chloroflexota bacterium]|nr:DUF5615 family PIN-like protein [Chloroflexota bacterium]